MDGHLVFSKIFVIISHNILTDALTKHRPDILTENWLIFSTDCDQQHEVQVDTSS